MRILYITSTLNRGGAEQQLYYLLKYARPMPEATVVSLGGSGDWEPSFTALGVRVIPLARRGKADFTRLFELRRIIRAEKYDLVHLWIDNVPGIYAHLAVFAAGHQRFITGERADIYSQPAWYRRFKQVALRRVKRVVCNSKTAEQTLVREGIARHDQADYIPNGIELERFSAARQPNDALTVGMVGSLTSVKNPELFVRAAAKVIEEHPTVRFMHIGKGPLMDDMHTLARELEIDDSITFYGQRDDVSALLGRMDIFALTSTSEGMPNAVMEAMAAGLPVVATDVGDCRELITDGENGLIVPTGDVNALASALIRLIEDAELRRRMGRRSHERIQAFDVGRMAQHYQAVYEQVMR